MEKIPNLNQELSDEMISKQDSDYTLMKSFDTLTLDVRIKFGRSQKAVRFNTQACQ